MLAFTPIAKDHSTACQTAKRRRFSGAPVSDLLRPYASPPSLSVVCAETGPAPRAVGCTKERCRCRSPPQSLNPSYPQWERDPVATVRSRPNNRKDCSARARGKKAEGNLRVVTLVIVYDVPFPDMTLNSTFKTHFSTDRVSFPTDTRSQSSRNDISGRKVTIPAERYGNIT
ncbi:hypothetical protein K435DRAFT_807196 [Dendrothele bispora CBS 962.96]|uniref:Uncharacterized protein n=1 Tax=Dendrothele bispora (strain CBS 962.96) TaxID=1314807 RepID=A0A4S8L5E7_DENBC|nr:hypothetical protein K435DRAFT_807196 [Dendrothele bispora CBS 962.96]